jgi:serine/threonine-protein kinase
MSEDKLILNQRYQLEDFLDKGGMAMVYRGRDLMLERDVAIKVLRQDYSKDASFRERFRQEAKAAANLGHSNIVTVYDFGYDDERLFIVMEYVPGTDLNSMIKKRGRYGIQEGSNLIIQACKGLGYAHRAGLVHCDIKPHNFLVTADGRVKITDFGIARALASINPKEESDVVWGSPQYFAPEQAAGGPPSPASDVYSIGVIMYRMFTGELPFNGKSAAELGKMHRYEQPRPAIELNPNIPEALNAIIMKVLSKEPAGRYRTADQLGRVLMTFAGPDAPDSEPFETPANGGLSDTSSRPVAVGEPRSNPVIDWLSVGLGLLAVLLVTGLLPFWMWVYFVFNPPIR